MGLMSIVLVTYFSFLDKCLCLINKICKTHVCILFLVMIKSWEDYEPTKATVKRLLLQESGKESTSRSSFPIDKQHFSPRLLEGSAITGPRDHISPATFLHPSENKGEPEPESSLILLLLEYTH